MTGPDPRPLRILTIAISLQSRGGLSREHLTVMQGLAARGHRIDLIYRDSGDFEADWRSFCASTTRVSQLMPGRRHPLRFVLDILEGARAARRCRPDVIYAYSPNFVFFATAVGQLTKTPVVLWLAFQGPPKRTPWSYRYGFRHVKKFLSVSRAIGDLWSSSGIVDGVTPVLAGIDMDYYRPAPPEEIRATRRREGFSDDDFLVLYAGRLVPQKGADVLLRAFALLGDVPNAKLVITADERPGQVSEWRQTLLRLADSLDVIWTPRRKDVVPLLQMVDVAVVPSELHEAFPRAACEPLACGVPVVASEVGGIPEIMQGWLAEYLVPPSDPEALARAIRTLVGWRQRDPGMARRCREAVEGRLSLPHFIGQIEAELAAAVSAVTGAGSPHQSGPVS